MRFSRRWERRSAPSTWWLRPRSWAGSTSITITVRRSSTKSSMCTQRQLHLYLINSRCVCLVFKYLLLDYLRDKLSTDARAENKVSPVVELTLLYLLLLWHIKLFKVDTLTGQNKKTTSTEAPSSADKRPYISSVVYHHLLCVSASSPTDLCTMAPRCRSRGRSRSSKRCWRRTIWRRSAAVFNVI